MSTRSATPASSARARARSACGADSVMPVTWTPWLTAAWTAKLPQPQPTSSRRSPALQAELACTRARAWSPGPPRASRPRARRSRSCRSSTRRGRARRTRPAGRSGGAPSGGRARSSAGAPRARARTAGAAGGRSRPIARAAASARRALVARSSDGGFQVLQHLDRAVEVVDLELARHVGPADARAAPAGTARGRRRAGSARSCAGPGAVAGSSVPSQKATVNGRSGSASASALRSGAGLREGQRLRVVSASSFFCWRAGSMRTTSHARPTFSRPRMTRLEESNSHQRIPWAAEVGNAWWLLCHASPKDSTDSHARLRDSSSVSKRRRPKKWHSELIEKVDVVQDEQPHGAAPQQAGQRGGERPADQPAQAERGAEAADRPSRGRCDRRSSRPDRRSGPARSACARRAGCAGRASPCARGPGRAARRASPRRDRRAGCADRRAGRRRRGACDGRPPRR